MATSHWRCFWRWPIGHRWENVVDRTYAFKQLASLVVAIVGSGINARAIRREQADRKEQIGAEWAREWAAQRPIVYRRHLWRTPRIVSCCQDCGKTTPLGTKDQRPPPNLYGGGRADEAHSFAKPALSSLEGHRFSLEVLEASGNAGVVYATG